MKRLYTKKKPLKRKSTEQRLSNVRKLENQVISKMEENCCNYEANLLSSRDTQVVFKHFKSLKKQISLPSELQHAFKHCCKERVKLLNNYFYSVFAPKIEFSVAEIDPNFTEIDSLWFGC